MTKTIASQLPRPSSTASGSRLATQRGRPFQLTGLGGVLAVFGTCFAGLLIAEWANWQELGDAVFFLASSLAAYYVRPGSLLPVVVSPPLLFLVACLAVSLLTAPGMLAGLSSMTLILAGAAWWMLAAMALTVVIGLLRGLGSEVRALVTGLRGE